MLTIHVFEMIGSHDSELTWKTRKVSENVVNKIEEKKVLRNIIVNLTEHFLP